MSSRLILENSKVKIIESVSFEKWVGGIESAGSGYHLYIEVASDTIQLDRIYFRSLKADIKKEHDGFKAYLKDNIKEDIVMSSNQIDELNNKLPNEEAFPFLLNDDECVISYFQNDVHKFIRVTNLIEKEVIKYPSAQPKN